MREVCACALRCCGSSVYIMRLNVCDFWFVSIGKPSENVQEARSEEHGSQRICRAHFNSQPIAAEFHTRLAICLGVEWPKTQERGPRWEWAKNRIRNRNRNRAERSAERARDIAAARVSGVSLPISYLCHTPTCGGWTDSTVEPLSVKP